MKKLTNTLTKKIAAVICIMVLMLGTATMAAAAPKSMGSIELNRDYTSAMADGKDKLNYSFSLRETGVVSVTFSHEYVDTRDTLWAVVLLDEKENEIFYQYFRGNTEQKITTANIGLPAGNYILRVQSGQFYYSTSSFTFRVNYTADQYWESERNGRMFMATPIEAGVRYSGSLCQNDDKDYYVFTLASDAYVTVSFSHEGVDASDKSWLLYLQNENEKKLYSESYKCDDVAVRTSDPIFLNAGTYYVLVQPNGISNVYTVDYHLTVDIR